MNKKNAFFTSLVITHVIKRVIQNFIFQIRTYDTSYILTLKHRTKEVSSIEAVPRVFCSGVINRRSRKTSSVSLNKNILKLEDVYTEVFTIKSIFKSIE